MNLSSEGRCYSGGPCSGLTPARSFPVRSRANPPRRHRVPAPGRHDGPAPARGLARRHRLPSRSRRSASSFEQPARPRGRVRQGGGGRRRAARARLLARRDRDHHAPPAVRKRPAAAVPAPGAPRPHQPDGVQQRWRGGVRGAAGGLSPADAARGSSGSTSARTRRRPTSGPRTTTWPASSDCTPHADYLVVNISSPNTPGLRAAPGARRARAAARRLRGRAAALPRASRCW